MHMALIPRSGQNIARENNMYDTFSNDYDRFVNWDGRLAYEMPFIERLLAPLSTTQPARVLDAACGTGMHAIELAKRNHLASGADLSSAMIARAVENANQAGVVVTFKSAGFGALAEAFQTTGISRFDALLCLGNSIPHLLTRPDLDRTLVDFAACLREGGLLLIQNRNFDAVLAAQERWMEPQAYREDEREWIFLRFYDYTPDGLINFNIITLFRLQGEPWQQKVESTRLCPWSHQELTAAVEAAGFTDIHLYGDMTGSPYQPLSSGNLILTASVR